MSNNVNPLSKIPYSNANPLQSQWMTPFELTKTYCDTSNPIAYSMQMTAPEPQTAKCKQISKVSKVTSSNKCEHDLIWAMISQCIPYDFHIWSIISFGRPPPLGLHLVAECGWENNLFFSVTRRVLFIMFGKDLHCWTM